MAVEKAARARRAPLATPQKLRTSRPLRLADALLLVTGLAAAGYAAVSIYLAAKLAHAAPKPINETPDEYGLSFRTVTFPARTDHLQLKGWFIPGVLPDGRLTAAHTIIMLHGWRQNRTDPDAGLLSLGAALAHRGFAVLTFDMRGHGESPAAPFSFGYFEQRDVLGAVDFLCSGPPPYPELGRTHAIAGWGASTGAMTLIFAAAREPAIQAVVVDDASPDARRLLEIHLPKEGGVPRAFIPGGLLAARIMYGIDYYSIRPIAVLGKIAPRPVFIIQPVNETYNPAAGFDELVAAASKPANARVQTWHVTQTSEHMQSYHATGTAYVDRLVAFYTAALG